MPKNIKLYRAGLFWWLGYEVKGRLHLLTRIGRVGDCIRR